MRLNPQDETNQGLSQGARDLADPAVPRLRLKVILSSEMGSSSDVCATHKSSTLSVNSGLTRSLLTAPRPRRVDARSGRGTYGTITGTLNRTLLSMTMWIRLGLFRASDTSLHAVALLRRHSGLLPNRSCPPLDPTRMTSKVEGQGKKADQRRRPGPTPRSIRYERCLNMSYTCKRP